MRRPKTKPPPLKEDKGGLDGPGTPPFGEVTAPEPEDAPRVGARFKLVPLEASQEQLLHFAVVGDRTGYRTPNLTVTGESRFPEAREMIEREE